MELYALQRESIGVTAYPVAIILKDMKVNL